MWKEHLESVLAELWKQYPIQFVEVHESTESGLAGDAEQDTVLVVAAFQAVNRITATLVCAALVNTVAEDLYFISREISDDASVVITFTPYMGEV